MEVRPAFVFTLLRWERRSHLAGGTVIPPLRRLSRTVPSYRRDGCPVSIRVNGNFMATVLDCNILFARKGSVNVLFSLSIPPSFPLPPSLSLSLSLSLSFFSSSVSMSVCVCVCVINHHMT